MAGFGAARDYTEKLFGGPVEELESVVATGVTPGVLVDNDPDSVALTFINLGANTVFLGLSPQVSSTNGLQLNSNGGSVSMNVTTDFTLTARRWYAVSPAGASTVYALRVDRFTLTAAGTA